MYLRDEPPWFAFLVHLRDIHDVHRWKGSRLLREYSDSDEEFLAKATSMEPTIIGEILFGFGGARGELVCAMRMPPPGHGTWRAGGRPRRAAPSRGPRRQGRGPGRADRTCDSRR